MSIDQKTRTSLSGWGISEVTPYSGGNAGIATVIPTPAFNSGSGGIPNIILLHIGTNDAGSFSATQMTNDLSGFLDKIISNAPNAYLVVAQIIPLGYGTNDVIKTYNQSIPGLVQHRVSCNSAPTLASTSRSSTCSRASHRRRCLARTIFTRTRPATSSSPTIGTP